MTEALGRANVSRSIRSKEEYLQLSPAKSGPESQSNIQTFLCAYVALAGRMIEIDCQTLKQTAAEPNAMPDLVATIFIQQLQWVGLTPDDSSLFRSLQTFDDVEPARIITWTIKSFSLAPFNGLKHLAQYVELLLDRFHNEQRISPLVDSAMRVVQAICGLLLTLPKVHPRGWEKTLEAMAPVALELLEFYKVLDAKLDTMVGKQAIILPQDIAKTFLQELGQVLRGVVAISAEIRAALLPSDFVSNTDLSKDQQSDLIVFAWFYQRYDKWIRHGRMELRVQGVEMIQNVLLSVYDKYVKNRRPGLPHEIAQYFASRLTRDELVAYLVSIESHPQLIWQSGNIVGYLIVLDRFTCTDSDTIWNSIASTQDVHKTDAILNMMQSTLPIAEYAVLLQFCESLGSMPIRAFDAKMLGFCTDLLDNLRRKFQPDSAHPRLDLAPYHLCVKLLRHAIVEPTLSQTRRREICSLAHSEMQALMSLGFTREDSKKIFRECVDDISSMSPAATGAIAAMNALIQRDPDYCMVELLSSFNIVLLAIKEFSTFLASHVGTTTPDLYDDSLAHRLTLLEHIVLQIPHAVDEEAASELWSNLMGPALPSEQARDLVWHRLAKILSCCMAENPFMDRCIRQYVPRSDPRYLTSGIITFTQQVLYYHDRICNIPDAISNSAHPTAAKELLWHITLSVPGQDLANEAIKMLVTLYSGYDATQQGAVADLQSTHLALVERCILQLVRSTVALGKLNDGTSSGEEESMVIIASEKEIQTQKYHFQRSLNVLKEVTKRSRSQAVLSPSPELMSEELRPIHGKRIRIHYQAFSGGVDKRQRSLEIGDLETFEALIVRLALLTGFSKFSAIAGGQRLDTEQSKNQTLREMKLDQKGQLLLRKAADAEPRNGLQMGAGLRPLEFEIMKHFDQLYNLLGMEEELGKEVGIILSHRVCQAYQWL